MLELYHWEPNTCFLMPLIALHEKQLPFSSRWFDGAVPGLAGESGFPDLPAVLLRPEREGPVLVHDGEVICGAFLILEYLAEGFPGAQLQGNGPFEQYRVRSWGQRLAGIAADVSLLGCVRHLAPVLARQDRAALMARLQLIEPLERRQAWSALLAEPDTAALGAARERLRAGLARLEEALAASPYLVGAGCTLADINAFAHTWCLPALTPDLADKKSTPHLMAFLSRMRARPAVQAALAMSRSGRPEEAFLPGPEPSRWG
jgi:glutathione S-transferase/GST-like protein